MRSFLLLAGLVGWASLASAQTAEDPRLTELTQAGRAMSGMLRAESNVMPEVDRSAFARALETPLRLIPSVDRADLRCFEEWIPATGGARAVTRPFCMDSRGTTMGVSGEYLREVEGDPNGMMVLAAGIYLRISGVTANNFSFARRLAQTLQRDGRYTSPRDGAAWGRGTEFTEDGSGRRRVLTAGTIRLGVGGGMMADTSRGSVAPLLSVSTVAEGHWNPDGNVIVASDVRAALEWAGNQPLYNVHFRGGVQGFPVLLGVWLAIDVAEYQHFYERGFRISAPLISIPINLGGRDYMMLRITGGVTPFMEWGEAGTGTRRERGLGGGAMATGAGGNGEIAALIRAGRYFFHFTGSVDVLHRDSPSLDVMRLELAAAVSIPLNLIFPNDGVRIEASQISYIGIAGGGPDVSLPSQTQLRGLYEVRF